MSEGNGADPGFTVKELTMETARDFSTFLMRFDKTLVQKFLGTLTATHFVVRTGKPEIAEAQLRKYTEDCTSIIRMAAAENRAGEMRDRDGKD